VTRLGAAASAPPGQLGLALRQVEASRKAAEAAAEKAAEEKAARESVTPAPGGRRGHVRNASGSSDAGGDGGAASAALRAFASTSVFDTPSHSAAGSHRRGASGSSDTGDVSAVATALRAATALPLRAVTSSSQAPDGSSAERVLYIVDIRQPQFNLEAEEEGGQLLLAAVGGLVVCSDVASSAGSSSTGGGAPGARTWAVTLHSAQAHAACDDDGDAPGGCAVVAPQWIAALGESAPAAAAPNTHANGLLRPIFQPCTIQFTATQRDDGVASGGDGSVEASLQSPAIEAAMESRQFAILLDVITGLLLSPSAGAAAEPRDAAAALLAAVARRARERATRRRGAAYLLEQSPDGAKAVADVADTLLEVLSCEAQAASLRACASLLTRPSLAAAATAAAATASAKAAEAQSQLCIALASAAAAARAGRPTPAFRVTLGLQRVAWSLRRRGVTFLSASLDALLLDSQQADNNSGTLTLRLHRLTLIESTAAASAAGAGAGAAPASSAARLQPRGSGGASATPPGRALLEAWDPSAVFKDEPMLAVTARRGPAELRSQTTYELLDVCIAPARVALTEALVSQLQAYFMPPDAAERCVGVLQRRCLYDTRIRCLTCVVVVLRSARVEAPRGFGAAMSAATPSKAGARHRVSAATGAMETPRREGCAAAGCSLACCLLCLPFVPACTRLHLWVTD
jgi:hypothetical protein